MHVWELVLFYSMADYCMPGEMLSLRAKISCWRLEIENEISIFNHDISVNSFSQFIVLSSVLGEQLIKIKVAIVFIIIHVHSCIMHV